MSAIESNLKYTSSNNSEYKKLKNDKLLATNEIWNIVPIMSTIFDYSDNKDLIEFNTVCKKWNLLTTRIIYRSIKLLSNQSARQIARGRSLSDEKIEAEAEECIANNSKYSHYVKEFKFCESIKPKTAIEVFETFKYLAILHINNVEISQDQFSCMVKPLDNLEELTFNKVIIKKILENRLYKESIQLPKTLTKLSLYSVSLDGNTELFNNAINTHSNLKIFTLEYGDESTFLTPFYECYSSLNVFIYSSDNFENRHNLGRIMESNPQITSLKLNTTSLEFLLGPISKYLINLQEFEFFNPLYTGENFEYDFFQPIKIKKLKLTSSLDSAVSWCSLLKNCPELEELVYIPIYGNIEKSILLNFGKPTKEKK
jgi:hypothetical protein